MRYYITDTEQEALDQDAQDYAEMKAQASGHPPGYWETTTKWATPVRRLDGKWARVVCPASTAQGRLIEQDDGSWFAVEVTE